MSKEKKASKIPKAITYQNIAKLIGRKHFPNKYYATSPVPGVVQILQDIGDGIVKMVPLEKLAIDILKFCERSLARFPECQLTAKEAEAAALYWAYSVEHIQAPKMFLWPAEEGIAFTRLPWAAVEGPCPTWDKLMERMGNAKAFKAWIWSLLSPSSYRQQYVWMHGKGNDGKGAINRVLAKIFGPAYCSKQPKERGDKFWTHELLGKRLVVFPDCNDQNFIASGFFKTLTGGDPVSVEAKGKMGYTVHLDAMYMVISNERPAISSETADMRRLIYCELAEREITDGEIEHEAFEEALWNEAGAFLHQCQVAFNDIVTAGKPIPTAGNFAAELAETNESHFADVFDLNFKIDKDDEKHWVEPIYLQRILKLAFRKRKDQLDFLSYLERVYGVKKFCKSDSSKCYKWLVPNPPLNVDAAKGKTDGCHPPKQDRAYWQY